ncbi:MAG: hypothetical protein IJY22_04425 [Clostridia bacterium]|nr:hypothetical protein [Clostridia bacterium]
MKNRKLMLATLLCATFLLLCVLSLASCGKGLDLCVHSYGEWTVTTEATCTAAGAKEHTCRFCGSVETVTVPALSHDWKEASCTEPKTCKLCAATEGEAPGHIGGVATCQDLAICTICNTAYGEKSTTNHTNPGEWCPAGVTTHVRVCLDCGGGEEAEHVYDESGCTICGYGCAHVWSDTLSNGDGTHTKTCVKDATHKVTESCYGGEATCTDRALCEGCHTAYGETKDHSWNAGSETKSATCLEAGERALTCIICSATKTEAIPALGHNMTDAVTAPTCTTKGYTTHTCDNEGCTVSYTDTEVDALGHAWNREKDCENGRACTRDNCTVSEEALGHDHKLTGSTPADCDSPATETYTCDREGCNDSYTNSVGSPKGHNLTGVTPEQVLKENETCIYVQVYECTVCYEDVIGTEVTNHTYKAAITTPATCSADGVKTLTCTACGDSYTTPIEKNETGHNWQQGTVPEGSNQRTDTCTLCLATKQVTVYTGTETGSTAAGDLADTEIELNDANINLGNDVINNAIGDQNISVSAGKTEGDDRKGLGLSDDQLAQVGDNPIYDFTIKKDNDELITDFGEDNYVTITLPYSLAVGEDVDNIAVWFINDEGELESIKATYNGGYVTFKTNHFSYYTVTRLTPKERCALYGHSYTTKTVEGDCLSDSYTLQVCARCHDSVKTVTEKADGHDYACVTTPATCTVAGKNVYTCGDCGASYETKIPATGHDLVESERVPASCAAPGYLTKTCENGCGVTETETFAQLKHVFTDSVVAPTCEAGGYTLHDCDNCDYSYSDTNTPATGHSYEASWSWKGFDSAVATLTCAHDATHSFTLNATVSSRVIESTCPAGNRTEYTAKVIYNGVVYTNVSENQSGNGEHRYTLPMFDGENHWNACVCGAKKDVTPHAWGEAEITEAATCGKDGTATRACACGATKEETLPATGEHTFGEPQVTKPATCGEDGQSVATCACGATETATIPATGEHSFTEGVCSVCGKEESTDAENCAHAELEEVTYNLADFGCCGGTMTVEKCKACGTLFVTEDMDDSLSCRLDDSDEEEGVLENGDRYLTCQFTCRNCALVIDLYAVAKVDGCDWTATYTAKMLFDGEELMTVVHVESWQNHNTENVTIDLSDYTTCGGVVRVSRCADCGAIEYISDLNPGCDDDNATEEQVEIDGVTYTIRTLDCPDCDMLYVMKQWIVYESVCEYEVFAALEIHQGETEILRYEDCIQDFSEHEYKYSYEKKGATCADGWTATVLCEKCGKTRTYSDVGHDTTWVEVNLEDYGFPCGGQADAAECRICGNVEIEGIYNSRCNWRTSDTVDADGYTVATCSHCGIVRRSLRTESEKDENCHYTVRTLTLYIKDGNELLRLEENYTNTDHDYEHTYVFDSDSNDCEDGVTVTYTCKACGNSYYHHNTSHSTLSEEYRLEDYGGCPNSYISFNTCPCGKYSYLSRNLYGCEYSNHTTQTEDANGVIHTTVTYTCRTCGLILVDEYYEEKDDCYIYGHHTVSLKIGETTVFEGKSFRSTTLNHTWEYDYTLSGDSCEDGVDVKMTCTVCGEKSSTYWSWHNTMSRTIDLAESGACEGSYIRIASCPCGEEGYVDRSLACKYETVTDSYTDGDGVEHTVYTRTCVECGLSMVEDRYEQTEGCYTYHYITMTITVNGTEVVSNELFCDGYNSNHSYVYSYTFVGDEDCEQGVYVTQTCANCDYFNEWQSHGHNTNIVEEIDLAEQGGCGGILYRYSCACGKRQDVELNAECPLAGTRNEYLDDDGNRHYVETLACSTCGLRYQTDRYTVRDAATCTAVTTVSGSVTVGANAVSTFAYENTEPSHDYAISADLMGNASCEDGVTVTRACKACGYSYTEEFNWHYTYELERIELDQYGSACHGYAELRGCACGYNKSLSLEHALCDLDSVSTELWIDGVLNQYYNYAEIRTCAVTDPQCGLKIRYASYWKQEEGSCLAYRYETWQFGYNEQDGTYQRELTYTVEYRTNHTWESTRTNGTWEGGTTTVCSNICSLCGSSELDTHYYDANSREVKYTRVFVNNLDNGENKRSEYVYEYAWYESKVTSEEYLQYTTRNYDRYIRANGSEYWYESVYTFDFENGCNRTVTYTNSNGESDSYTEVWHTTSWIHIKDATCTQDGSEGYRCRMCGEITDTWPIQPQHNWVYVTDGHYFCSDCGLENSNGASGDVIMEDMTASYGDGTHYVVGYYCETSVQFTYYVALITAEGEEIIIDVAITERNDIRALTFSKADVLAAATAQGLAEGTYDVRLTFVPYGADGTLDYAITLTEQELPTEITDDTTFVHHATAKGEEQIFIITPTQDCTVRVDLYTNGWGNAWITMYEFNSEDDDSHSSSMTYHCHANTTYILKVVRDSEADLFRYVGITVTFEYENDPEEGDVSFFPTALPETMEILENAGYTVEVMTDVYEDSTFYFLNAVNGEDMLAFAFFESDAIAESYYDEVVVPTMAEDPDMAAEYGIDGSVIWLATDTDLFSIFA